MLLVVAISDLVLQNHLLRKVDKVLDLNYIYLQQEDKYCLDDGSSKNRFCDFIPNNIDKKIIQDKINKSNNKK
uniref:Putative transposase n=1 Tax=Macrococcoides caseolyticum TaxID=69966 RepID=A0A097PT92_9STAP|nr:hypothetical protein [Macrococcus caseolyticus]AIU53939.1 putative transposase [Macrococcus caseolyticus]